MWIYTIDGKQQASVSEKELKNLARIGVLKPTDLIWFDGLEEWRDASKVPWLNFSTKDPQPKN